jgi:ATP-dependent RNA helicase RhlE
MNFSALGLSPHIVQSTLLLGYRTPFPIQEKAVPVILSGKDLFGIAPTGSGKTASFVMPILDKLQSELKKAVSATQVLVLAPTRELAIQIEAVFKAFTTNLKFDISTAAVYGGAALGSKLQMLKNVNVLVATPGRLLELLEKNIVNLKSIAYLVIDEADKLFQLGFETEMNQILDTLPANKQVILFSATLNEQVDNLKARLNIQPEIVAIDKEDVEVERIQQIAYQLPVEKKGPFLRYLIKTNPNSKILVFVAAQRTADNVVDKLKKNKISAVAVHGNKGQSTRVNALQALQQGNIQVLVTTDLMSRGIHIDDLPIVINYDLPRSPLDYIHRIGRTGRALGSGTAISLITEDDKAHFKVIQKKMKQIVELESIDSINLQGY